MKDQVDVSAYTFPTMAIRELRDFTQYLSGRMKTIVDATIPDGRQNKAIKDVMHEAVWDSYRKVVEWAEYAARLDDETPRAMFPFSNTDSQVNPG